MQHLLLEATMLAVRPRSTLLSHARNASTKARPNAKGKGKASPRVQAPLPPKHTKAGAANGQASASRTIPVNQSGGTGTSSAGQTVSRPAAASASAPVSPLKGYARPKDSFTDAVTERLVYSYEDKNLPNPRMVYGVGFMLFAFCVNAADIIRREPRQPADPDAPRIEVWPAWKRFGGAFVLLGAGVGIASYAIYWPTRIVKKMYLLAPSATATTATSGAEGANATAAAVQQARALLPSLTSEFSQGLHYTTPYHECKVKLVTAATESIPQLFKPKVVDFNDLRLLGPLSATPKWYHKQFPHLVTDRSWKDFQKNGRVPSNVPLKIAGKREGYSLRRSGGAFTDMEGLERALLENGKA